jgi:hypothetical protein
MVGLGRPSRRSLPIAAALATSLSCTGAPTEPTPGTVPPPGNEQTSICHHLGPNSFALTVVIEREVPAHMAHGDGRINDLVPEQPDLKFGSTCEFLPLVQATVTFNELVGDNGTPFVSHEEAGLTVTTTDHIWEVLATHGKPRPSIIFKRIHQEPDSGEIRVFDASGGLFQFSSVDLYSSVTQIPYIITAFRKLNTAFILTGTLPGTFGAFASVFNSDTRMIDSITIRLTNPASFCCGNPMGLDNITIRR